MTEQATPQPADIGLTREQLLDIDYFMRLNRSLEERVVTLFRQSKVIGGIYRSLGQEGESVGSAYALDFANGDIVAPLIRNMGALLVAGAEPVEIFRQYMAKGNGPSRGRDLNIHFADLARGFIGPVSMLGDMIPIVAGITMGNRMQGRNIVGMAYLGDGASSTGAFYEGLNFAAVQRLPMIVIIENNGYAYSTPTSKQTAARTLADKAMAVGCASEIVDGNDAIASYHATRRAMERARSGEGVTLIEMKTFRMKGHAEHDNQSYVPLDLIEDWRKKDPIEQFEKRVSEAGILSSTDFEAIQKRVKEELDRAVDEAERSPMPKPEEAQYGTWAGDGFWDRPTAE